MQVGQKFEVNAKFFVEILGFFPAGGELDRKAKYLATLNGYKMKVEADFLEALEKASKEEPKEEKKEEVKKGGRRKRNA